MSDVAGAAASGAVGGLLARGRRPPIMPGRMLFAEALTSVDEPLQPPVAEPTRRRRVQSPHVDVRGAERRSAGDDRAAEAPSTADGGGIVAEPVQRRAPSASVDVEPGTAIRARVPLEAASEAAPHRPRTSVPDGPLPPALSPRRASPTPAPARDAARTLRTDPTPTVTTLTERVLREPIDAPVVPVPERSQPETTVATTEASAPPTDRGPAHVGDPTPPVTIGEIHVHVAAPADAPPDPLALLAPWADGLTARRRATA